MGRQCLVTGAFGGLTMAAGGLDVDGLLARER
jgi:hypothetical protein